MLTSLESPKRSIVKALSWRLIAAVVTVLVVYLITREVSLSLGAGLLDSGIKLFFYYFHERMWNRLGFGRRKAEIVVLPCDNAGRPQAVPEPAVSEVAGNLNVPIPAP